MTDEKWYENHYYVADLAEYLDGECWEFERILEMLRKPWAFNDEWNEYRATDND